MQRVPAPAGSGSDTGTGTDTGEQGAPPPANAPGKTPVALQLWTVRHEARRDFAGTLRQVAALGYAGVEHVHSLGYGGLAARQVRALMGELGLGTAGGHVELSEWEADMEAILDYHAGLGARHVAVSWVPAERRRDESAYVQMADALRHIGARCRDRGIRLVYHHHDFEFVRFGGRYALELLLERVPPELLGVEVDVHWARRAGEDPATFLGRVGGRCALVHFKDLSRAWAGSTDHADPEPFTEVGTGIIDFGAVARASAHVPWRIVEQDFCAGSAWDSARRSLENLRQMGLA